MPVGLIASLGDDPSKKKRIEGCPTDSVARLHKMWLNRSRGLALIWPPVHRQHAPHGAWARYGHHRDAMVMYVHFRAC